MASNKQVGGTLYGEVRLTGFEQIKGGFATSKDYVRRLELPKGFKLEDVQRALKDCEILAAKLRDTPEEMSALLDAILRNNIEDAKQRAHKLGLTEQEFLNQGGGLMWLVVVAVLLYATDAY